MSDQTPTPTPVPAPAADPPKSDYTPPASQADLDRIITNRIHQERSKFADYGDLQAKATELDKLKAAQATDQEKAVNAAVSEALTTERKRSNSVLVSSEARAQAAAAKFRDPADALGFLDLSSVKVTDDGQVDRDAVKALLGGLATDKPYLLTDSTPPPPPLPGLVGIGVGAGPGTLDPRAADLAQIEADMRAGKKNR